METFLFYDLETTGLSPDFDQVLQFAAIRTDSCLNEISRHQFYVRLSPDRVPAEKAVTTHKISPEITSSAMSEYDAIKHIHTLMNQPKTCSIGYNTLAFDDNFLRFSFFRFLLDPYTHQYANGCRRADLFLMILPFFKFAKHSLVWPEPLSLKLENLATAQGIEIGAAHDAMNDVIATLELARLLFKHTDQWQYALGRFNKNNEQLLNSGHRCLWLTPKLGYDSEFAAPVIILGEHSIYKHKLICRLDDPVWPEVYKNKDYSSLHVYRKKPSENGFFWPYMDRYLENIDLQYVDLSYEFCLDNMHEMQDFFAPQLQEPYPLIPDLDVDSAIYQLGFKSRSLKILCSLFNSACLNEKIRLISEFPEPYKEQAIRIVWRIDEMSLPSEYDNYIEKYLNKLSTGMSDHVGRLHSGTVEKMQELQCSESDLAKKWFCYLGDK